MNSSAIPPTKNKQLYSNWTLIKKRKMTPITMKVLFKLKIIIDSIGLYRTSICTNDATKFWSNMPPTSVNILKAAKIKSNRLFLKIIQKRNSSNVSEPDKFPLL